MSKTKNEVSSLNIKLKWAQNKLKSESEAHKEAQAKLAITLQKLQESKEEGEQIRNDMKAMIVAYQVSNCICVHIYVSVFYVWPEGMYLGVCRGYVPKTTTQLEQIGNTP